MSFCLLQNKSNDYLYQRALNPGLKLDFRYTKPFEFVWAGKEF